MSLFGKVFTLPQNSEVLILSLLFPSTSVYLLSKNHIELLYFVIYILLIVAVKFLCLHLWSVGCGSNGREACLLIAKWRFDHLLFQMFVYSALLTVISYCTVYQPGTGESSISGLFAIVFVCALVLTTSSQHQ